ncbi:hypothetical protein Tco_1464753 [Tanacetum coccineum]
MFFIGGDLPRTIEGNVTTSKPQTLEEAIAITQRLMDQLMSDLQQGGSSEQELQKLKGASHWKQPATSDSRIEWWKAMEGARVMTRGFGDLVAKLGDKRVMEVLVRCWSDGDVVPILVPVIWLPFTNRNSDEAQTSDHG